MSALALLAGGLTLLAVPDVADAAGAGDTVFIDDPLQAGSLAAWEVAGTRWTPELRTVAQNNDIEHSINTKDCSPWPTCLATYDSDRDGNWLTLTTDNTHDGLGESGFVLHKTPFSSDRGVVIEYDQRVYRTNNGKFEVYGDGTESMVQGGGDGISLFLVDANAPDYGRPPTEIDTNIAQPGGYGAGLGYSSVADTGASWCPAQPGIAGAYLGIGFDVYGNYQKAETALSGVTNPATRPASVSGNNPDAKDARLPQSIGLRGSGVRFRDATTCDEDNQDSLDRHYGMIRFPEVNNDGYVTFYSKIWDAGTSASDYRFQYRTPNGDWHNWFDMEPSTRGGTTSGYMQARVPTTALPVTFAIQKKSDVSRYSETANLSQDAIVDGANRTLLETRQGGYRWLAGTDSHGSTTTGAWIDNTKGDARDYRRVRVTLTPKADGSREVVVSWSDKLSVTDDVCVDPDTKEPNGLLGAACSGTAGEWRAPETPTFTEQFRYDLAESDYQAAMPAQFQLGFAASTGWAVNFHQIRNLRVTSPTDLAVDKTVAIGAPTSETTWVDSATGQAGDTVSYRIVATNEGPSPLDPAFPATLVDPMTDVPFADRSAVTWTATATNGAQVRIAGATTWETTVTGNGPLTGENTLEWHSPDRTTAADAAVTVVITGLIDSTESAGTYPNTATIVPSPAGGPQDSDPSNNTDDAQLVLRDGDTWRVAKTADPASGTTVSAGTEITYSVTATADGAAGRGDVRGIVLTDDLADVLDDATFVPGSATLTIGSATPVAVDDPVDSILETQPFNLAHGTSATLTYRVTVRTDVGSEATLRNVVVGDATSGEPETCAPPADPDDETCSTVHTTPEHPYLQVLKQGEADNGDVVPMDGSQWAIYSDADLTNVVVDPLDAVPGETGLFRTQLEPGTYWLVETRALEGFQLLPTPVEFTVAADGKVTLANPTSYLSVRDDTADDHAWTVVVQDIPMLDLPEAGGRSPAGIIAAGVLFTLLAGALAVRTRRTTTGRP